METFFLPLCTAMCAFIAKAIANFGGYLSYILKWIKVDIVPADAVTSVGVSLTTLFFTMEMFSQVAQFRMERIEDAIRIGMRFVVAKVIIENTAGISKGIYGMFRIVAQGSIENACNSISGLLSTITIGANSGGFLGTAYLLLFLTSGGIACIFIIMFVKIAINFAGIAFEIGVHQALAPIALSTLCNDMTRPTGIAFIKSYAASCLQITVMTAIFTVFADIFTQLSGINLVPAAADLGIFTSVISFIAPLICTIALSKAVKLAGDMTKRMFGA